jgi:hypothetical protein
MGSARRRRRLLRTVLCALCLGAFVAALLTDLSARAGLRHQRSLLASAEARLGASEGVARGTLATFSSTLDERNLLDESVAQGAAQVASTGQTLNTASQSAFFATVHANEIHTCLGGVQGALGQIAASNTQGAATALAGVSATCLDLSGGSTSGLVYPFDFPDPFVLRVGSTYWGYATNSAAGNIQIITSSDLANWTTVGNALPALPSWAQPGATWAPSVIQLGATFVLYYAAATAASGTSCISVATASAPQGPFVDNSSAPLIDRSLAIRRRIGQPLPDVEVERCRRPAGHHLGPAPLGERDPAGRLRGDPTADPEPGMGERRGRGPVDVRRAGPVLPLLLGQQLGQRRLRHRLGSLPRPARALHEAFGHAARLGAGVRRARWARVVHRPERQDPHGLPRLGAGCGGLPEQP